MDWWDVEASAEQVAERMLSVNLSGWCLRQARPEKCNRTTLSRRQTAGRNVSLISNQEILYFKKAMNMIMPNNRCSLTHAPRKEKPCMSKQAGSGGKEATFPTCVCDINIYIQRFGQGRKRELWSTEYKLNGLLYCSALQCYVVW